MLCVAPAEQESSTEEQTQDVPQEKEREKEKNKEKHPVYALENSQGLQALQVMLEQPVVSTILLDFKMFDDAETSGSMPSFYRADFYLPGYSYSSRGRSGYSRGGGRGGRGSYSSRNRGGFHSGTFVRSRVEYSERGSRSRDLQETTLFVGVIVVEEDLQEEEVAIVTKV